MIEPTALDKYVNAAEFIAKAMKASTSTEVEALLAQLPITPEDEYAYSVDTLEDGWQPDKFHWVPVGRERGNAGRIKQANQAVSPIAERTVNGMEAIIEMARQRELATNPNAPPPMTPRGAVTRYFGIPPLDQLPKLDSSTASKVIRTKARELASQLRVRLLFPKATKEFTVAIEDDGIGQPPSNIHKTLLSLGSTTKADKWYLIGVFGQGGSSAYSECKYSWMLSRRAPDLLQGAADGAGWTIIKHVFPKGRRDDYFAYLACHPDGRVPFLTATAADGAKIPHGTRFVHIGYNFGSGGSAINRQLYTALNHVLYNPVLPYELYVGNTAAPMYGNGYRLSSLGLRNSSPAVLDKIFPPQPVGA